MNTHDKYELPPLPEARIVSYQTDSTMRSMELRTHSDEDMRDYARAAIEADRQRRGEPRIIGEILLDAKQHPFARLRTGYDENGDQWKEGTPIYAAPQPAEPVTWPLVTWWDGAQGPAERLAESLEGYAKIKPGANRDVWAMKAAAKWIRAVLAAPQPAAPVVKDSLTAAEQAGVRPSEAVFAFAAWLTCRTETTSFASHLDAAPAAQLVSLFIDSQGWADPREDYVSRLKPYPVEQTAYIAEPVKVPSDADIIQLFVDIAQKDEVGRPYMDISMKEAIEVSRALLARYGSQPAEPNEWKQAVDDELTSMHSTADSFPSAREAVKALVDWHVSVATDPVFQPAEPVKVPSDAEIIQLFIDIAQKDEIGRPVMDISMKEAISISRALLARYGSKV